MTDETSQPHGEVRDEAKTAKRERTEAKLRARDAKRSAREAAKAAKREASSLRRGSRLRDIPSEVTVRIVFVMVGANAATQFAIQAWMSYRFAKDVWVIPRPLCVAIIVALDLFAVTFMVFTYLLRRAGWISQAYVWAIFAGAVGAQLFAAELYGAKEEWTGPVRLFSALPALFLAASLHGLIIWRNHSAESAPKPATEHGAPPGPRPQRTPELAKVAAPVSVDRPAQPKPQVKPVAPALRPGAVNHSAEADRVIANKATAKQVADELGVSPRAVQLWVKARRKQLDSAPPKAFPQVNGHAFHVEGPSEVEVN